MIDVHIRVNGRGNAWPLGLGARVKEDPRQATLQGKPWEYSNTSLSILGIEDGEVRWDILFDVGQGIVPFLIQNGNRLPDAVILSHPHYDHVSGLDWLVNNHKQYKSALKLKVYSSKPCWDMVMQRDKFGYLKGDTDWQELKLGETLPVKEAPGLSITAFPVFHGDHAPGAILLLAEYEDERPSSRFKAVFTGDLLCPLLRQQDFQSLTGAQVLYADANMRFPWPGSGHWSIVDRDPDLSFSAVLDSWTQRLHPSYLITPHFRQFERQFDVTTYSFLDQFLTELMNQRQTLCWSVFEFARRIHPNNVELVHYRGYDDFTRHHQQIMNDTDLLDWVKKEAHQFSEIHSMEWNVPEPGEYFPKPVSKVQEDKEWLKAAAVNPAFDFLKEPEEDIYTLSDGKPFYDQG